jgi:dihydrolipoamide dehydrogenase
MNELRCKVLVIGGGPGGYVAAIRAGQLGLDTILVEGGPLGGTCLNVGCIPSKALIHAAGAAHGLRDQRGLNAIGLSVGPLKLDLARTIAWKDSIVAKLTNGVGGLLKKAKVRTLLGTATIADGKTATVRADTGETRIVAEHLVLATGSEPVELSAFTFGGDILSSTDALALTEVPQSLAVVGAGYIGMELGIAFAKLGAKVTIVEALAKILPLYDAELTQPVARRLADLGVETLVGAKAIAHANGALRVMGADGAERSISAAKALVAVGRRACMNGFGLETLDLTMSGSFVRIDAQCATSMRNVWAIGDVTGEPMLAHRAMAQGEMVAEIIAGQKRAFDPVAIPAICFTDPEIVAVGLSPDAAKAAHGEVRVGHFPFRANGRAMTLQDDDGFVRVVARADNHVVLGVQAVGAGVSELSAAFALSVEMGARLEDIALTIHAHPTLSEAFHESALAALGHSLHI